MSSDGNALSLCCKKFLPLPKSQNIFFRPTIKSVFRSIQNIRLRNCQRSRLLVPIYFTSFVEGFYFTHKPAFLIKAQYPVTAESLFGQLNELFKRLAFLIVTVSPFFSTTSPKNTPAPFALTIFLVSIVLLLAIFFNCLTDSLIPRFPQKISFSNYKRHTPALSHHAP